MARLRNFVHNHKTLFMSLGFLVIFSITVSYAAPLVSPYTPGQTLDPSCAPGDTNCTVSANASQWTTTGNNIYYNTGNVGIGTTTPTDPLDVNGEIKAKNLNISGIGSQTVIAAPSGLQATFDYTSGTFGAHGYTRNYEVYAYKLVNGVPGVFSSTYATLASPITDDSSGNNYNVDLTWNAVPGADGYRILIMISAGGNPIFSYDHYQDSTTNSFVDTTFNFINSPGNTVTPTSVSTYSNVNTINGNISTAGDLYVSGSITCGGICGSQWDNVTGGINYAGGKVGVGTTAPATELDLEGDGAILATGSQGQGVSVPSLGAGIRMMWFPSNASFRAGLVSGTDWDSSHVGFGTVAFGADNTVSGQFSFSGGTGNTVAGPISLAYGSDNTISNAAQHSIAIGADNNVSGNQAGAFGDQNTVSGTQAFAFGNSSTASGATAFALGTNSQATASGAFAGGQSAVSSGEASFAFGDSVTASGNFSVAMGTSAQSTGFAAVSLGDNTAASDDYAFAGGDTVTVAGQASFAYGSSVTIASGATFSAAFGQSVNVSGVAAFAAGQNLTASGGESAAFGENTTAYGPYSFVAGNSSSAIGRASVAFGVGTAATGDYSVAFGSNSSAIGDYSGAFGATTAGSQYDFAIGKYNTGYSNTDAQSWTDTDPLFEIGNGNGQNNDANEYSDAFVVLKNGYTGMALDPTAPTPRAQLEVGGDGTIIAMQTNSSGNSVPDLGAGTRLTWDPSNGAFRAGIVDSTEWNSANVGQYSAAFGAATTASGFASFATGLGSIASGSQSVAFGGGSVASGDSSFAISGTASGDYSFALGGTASAYGSVALGTGTAAGQYSVISGEGTNTTADDELAIGTYNVGGGTPSAKISTDPLFEVGNGTSSTALSDAFSVIRNGTVGIGTVTPAATLDVRGHGSILVGTQLSNTIGNSQFFAFGDNLQIGGQYAFAEGDGSKALGQESAAFGTSTASGNYSAAFNQGTASGTDSSAFGDSTIAAALDSTAIGAHNLGVGTQGSWVSTDPLFEIGNGTNGSALSDALVVLKNGDTGINLDPASPTPSYSLQVGNSSVTGVVARFQNSAGTCDINPLTSSLTCSSDMTLKKNVTNLGDDSAWNFNTNITPADQSVLSEVLALNPVDYNWKTESDTAAKHPGFIAQEVQQVFPDLVATDPTTHLLSLNYTGLIPYTVEAIKEMNLNVTNIDDLAKANTWRDAITNWLADSANGIKSLVVQNQICVDDQCLTKNDIHQLLQLEQQQAAQSSNPNAPMTTTVTSDQNDPAPTADTSGDTGTSQSPEVDQPAVTTDGSAQSPDAGN